MNDITPEQEQAAVHASMALGDLVDELPTWDPMASHLRVMISMIDKRFRIVTISTEVAAKQTYLHRANQVSSKSANCDDGLRKSAVTLD
jgi:hypothetical protein